MTDAPPAITERRTREIVGTTLADFSTDALLEAQEPVILRGLAADWPLVAAGRRGAADAIAYLKRFDAGRPVVGYTGDPAIGGRFFYRDDLSSLNFDARRVGLSDYVDRIAAHLDDPAAPSLYLG